MADIVSRISYAMSLRGPQKEALSYLDAISTHCDYQRGRRRGCRYRTLRKAAPHQSRRQV